MKTMRVLFFPVLAACLVSRAGEPDLKPLVRQAVDGDDAAASSAVAALRSAGPAGLRALLDTHAALIQAHRDASAAADPRWKRLYAAINSVSGQRDAHTSCLYWHTDIEKAKAASQASGKPILSLRLLGKLDEECSCANSRFFRTTLYSNAEVSKYLGDHFVLHWKSVRPVPKITIDFGDGRKLERTITGNSIHYVLDSDGRIVDALPGLYGPAAFLNGLAAAEAVALECRKADDASRAGILGRYHLESRTAIAARWSADLEKARVPAHLAQGAATIPSSLTLLASADAAKVPVAREAGVRAVGKAVLEMPVIAAMQPGHEALEKSTDAETWTWIAALHASDARLDAASRGLIAAKNPTAYDASKLTVFKAKVEDPFLRVLRNLERSIAEDTVRNEYLFHSRIHEWLGGVFARSDVEVFNDKVYAELFLTPRSDPWLGLNPPDTFTALENDGVVMAP